MAAPSPTLELTPGERAWLAAHPVIRVGIDPHWYPLEFADDQGRHAGISADYLALLEPLLGVRFKVSTDLSWSEVMAKIRARELDMLAMAAETPERAEYLNFTRPYIRSPMVIVTQVDVDYLPNPARLIGKTVAVVQDYASYEWLKQAYPQLDLEVVSTTTEGLEQVATGHVFALVDNLASVSFLIREQGLSNLKVSGQLSLAFDLALASRNDWPTLHAILDKALAAISQKERDAIYDEWISAQYRLQIDYQRVWQVLGVALVIVAIILYWNRRLSITRAALQKSEHYYRALISSMGEGLVVQKADGRIVICNQSAERILGIPRNQLLGLNVFDWQWQTTDGQGRPLASADFPVMTTLRTGEPQSGFLMGIATPRGEERWLLINTQPLYGDGRARPLESVIATFTDISPLKQLERELRQTAAVAEAASHAKSDFLANMSHEIRTPMNAVLGMLHLAMERATDARQHGYLTEAQRAAKVLLNLLNDILDFSKVEAGQLELEQIPFSLSGVLGDIETVVGCQARTKGLAFEIVRQPEIPDMLIGDPLRLGQVLINLTNNAVKFTEQGRVEVSLELKAGHADRARIEFSVRDTGIGIDQEQLANLFQAFQQADSSTTRRYGGTGLGLSISKRLVELMGGGIQVASESGVGSLFSFCLDFALPQFGPLSTVAHSPPAADATATSQPPAVFEAGAMAALSDAQKPLTKDELKVLRAQLERLHALASRCDTLVEDAFIEQRQQLAVVFPLDTIITLAELVDRFRFDEATVLLERMIEQMATRTAKAR